MVWITDGMIVGKRVEGGGGSPACGWVGGGGDGETYSHLQVLRIYFGAFCVSSWPPPVRSITVPTAYSKCVFRFLTEFAYSKYLQMTIKTKYETNRLSTKTKQQTHTQTQANNIQKHEGQKENNKHKTQQTKHKEHKIRRSRCYHEVPGF